MARRRSSSCGALARLNGAASAPGGPRAAPVWRAAPHRFERDGSLDQERAPAGPLRLRPYADLCALPSCGRWARHRCARCGDAYYCAVAHQRRHWRRHRGACEERAVPIRRPRSPPVVAEAPAPAPAPAADGPSEDEQRVMELGFSRDEASFALHRASGNVDEAAAFLLGGGRAALDSDSDSDGGPPPLRLRPAADAGEEVWPDSEPREVWPDDAPGMGAAELWRGSSGSSSSLELVAFDTGARLGMEFRVVGDDDAGTLRVTDRDMETLAPELTHPAQARERARAVAAQLELREGRLVAPALAMWDCVSCNTSNAARRRTCCACGQRQVSAAAMAQFAHGQVLADNGDDDEESESREEENIAGWVDRAPGAPPSIVRRGGVSAPPAEPWACPACTFINDPAENPTDRCGVCMGPR